MEAPVILHSKQTNPHLPPPEIQNQLTQSLNQEKQQYVYLKEDSKSRKHITVISGISIQQEKGE